MVRSIAAIVLIGLLTTPSFGAQAVGASVSGVVLDESSGRLPGVTITITNLSNGRTHTVITGEHGQYRAVALQPAAYRIAAGLAGFTRFEQDVALTVGADATLDFRLSIEGPRERVTVAPSSLSLQVAQSQPSSVVVADQIRTLPELGRSFVMLAQLLPGSGPLTTVGRFATTKFGGAADQRSAFTTLIDGGDVDDAQWGVPTINLTQESVQEFKVFRHQFDAQYGNALSAVVSVVTRAGGNRLDASALYFGRDDALNARNAFARGKTPFDEQRAGGTLGGPIVTSRTHFFGAYERDNTDTVRIIANPRGSVFEGENGIFPAASDTHMMALKIDHRLSDTHSAFARYAYDNQASIRSGSSPASDTSQVDIFSRAHSLVGEEDWILSNRAVNTLRLHVLRHTSGAAPHHPDRGPGIFRPAGRFRQTRADWQTFPRTDVALADAVYFSTARHDVKFGGEFTFGKYELDAHFFEDGFFQFQTDAPFKADDASTWPRSFVQQAPSVASYTSRQVGLFVQDDWRLANRVRVNLGVRYDLDTNLRINDAYARLLADPSLTGLNQFVSGDRGTDTNNLQPRVGATFDVLGNGTLVLRGGFGMYVTRNRPWFQVRSLNQLEGSAIRIEDPARLRLFPDVAAVVAGGGPGELGTVIPDNLVLPYALNTTVGAGWRLTDATSLDIDYIHSYGAHQQGLTDRNLPAVGAIGPANPRPAPQFAQVAVLENFTESWYDALETQLRTRFRGASLQASYTLSRSYIDGVDHFLNQRGTQRTPQERGYSPSDQRHNLTVAGSMPLPWQMSVTGILKLISGTPMLVQAGSDLDGDGSILGDRPRGLPITVGRGDRRAALRLINELRATFRRPDVDASLLEPDPYRSLDLRLTKAIRLGSNRRIELLIEGFNVTNHVNYVPLSVVPSINSGAFLQRRSARDARQIQWGARVVF